MQSQDQLHISHEPECAQPTWNWNCLVWCQTGLYLWGINCLLVLATWCWRYWVCLGAQQHLCQSAPT
jgi:hypothetical protein